jgi:hypothetical protein
MYFANIKKNKNCLRTHRHRYVSRSAPTPRLQNLIGLKLNLIGWILDGHLA